MARRRPPDGRQPEEDPSRWQAGKISLFLIFSLGEGHFLLADQEIRRLKRAIRGVEAQLEAMEAIETEGTHGLFQ